MGGDRGRCVEIEKADGSIGAPSERAPSERSIEPPPPRIFDRAACARRSSRLLPRRPLPRRPLPPRFLPLPPPPSPPPSLPASPPYRLASPGQAAAAASCVSGALLVVGASLHAIDLDGDGVLSYEELMLALESMNKRKRPHAEQMKQAGERRESESERERKSEKE